jgi:hypothetical protein
MRGRMDAIWYGRSQVFQRVNKEENMRVACISGIEIMDARTGSRPFFLGTMTELLISRRHLP